MEKEVQDIIILNLSGAATKIAGLAGVADYLYNVLGYRPTDITGISSGALLTVGIAMRKWDVLRDFTQSFTLDDIFDRKPVNKKNKITLNAKIRAIIGKPSLGTQGNLYKTLRKVITPEDFKRYQEGDFPNCWIGSVDVKTGARFICNVKESKYSYDDYLHIVIASTSIPLAVEPVLYKDMILFDGGIRNHILSAWALEYYGPRVKETISVFSRPEEYHGILDRDWEARNIINVFERYNDITVIEISKRDEREEKLQLALMKKDKHKIKNAQVFIPSIIKELYDTDPTKLRKLYSAGFKAAANKLGDW